MLPISQNLFAYFSVFSVLSVASLFDYFDAASMGILVRFRASRIKLTIIRS